MTHALLQICMACLGSLGFGILFRVRIPRLPWVALGGGLTWCVYLGCTALGAGLFAANLIAALFAAAYAEILARTRKAPSTVFVITAAVPLIPGGGLYYTMESAVAGNHEAFFRYGTNTALTAGAIAFGLLLFAAFLQLFYSALARLRNRK